MGKGKALVVKLASTAGTGYFYTAVRNPSRVAEKKLVVRKYDPIVRRHVLFTESKMPSGRKR